MARRRFFVGAIHEGSAELTGDDAHHLARVLRAEPGQRYEISDGRAVWLAEIVELRKDRVGFRAVEPVESAGPALRLTVCAALVKFDRFEWMIEKTTELGVERLVAFQAARSDKGLREAAAKRLERWRKVARESGQQARRLKPPAIELAAGRPTVAAAFRYFLDEVPGAPPILAAIPRERHAGEEAALLVGPEGGWTPSEREEFPGAGWTAVSLGPQVLRAETAIIAAAAALFAAWDAPRPIE